MIKTYRAGSLTTGLFFISLGVALLVKLVYEFSLVDLFYWGWPILLILLGLEINLLVYQRNKQGEAIPIRYDLLGLFTFILFALVTLGLYMVEESGVSALAQQSLSARYFAIESPVYTVDDLSQIEQIKVIGQHGEIKLQPTDKEALTVYSTWENIAALDWEEAQQITAKTIEMMREGKTLYLFLRKPPQTNWSQPSAGNTTLLIPAHVPLEMDLEAVQLTITLDQLNNDWNILNDHGSTHIYAHHLENVAITAQGLGDNLSNPSVWDEVKEDHSWGKVTGGDDAHQLRVFTQTGKIHLDKID